MLFERQMYQISDLEHIKRKLDMIVKNQEETI